MSTTYKKIGDTYVVWFAPANRFMQLHEPAFRILEDWSSQFPEDQIIWNCTKEFELPLAEASRFVKEVTSQLQSMVRNYTDENIVSAYNEVWPIPDELPFSTKNYLINGKYFQFNYRHSFLEDLIHPGFASLEIKFPENEAIHCFELLYNDHSFFLQTGGKNRWKCPDSKPENYLGLVYLQMLNGLNNTTDAYWMGAVHASAVSAGKGAILFTAPTANDKSTFAAMLMNKGYQVLSNDFSPISINPPKIYPFPEGISVKNRSLHLLQTYFPELAGMGDSIPDYVREVFISISTGAYPLPEFVKAIVLLQYDSDVELELDKISNLDAMDRFLPQLWLPPTNELAAQFLDWYFQLPCYSLKYSDPIKAIASVSKLF